MLQPLLPTRQEHSLFQNGPIQAFISIFFIFAIFIVAHDSFYNNQDSKISPQKFRGGLQEVKIGGDRPGPSTQGSGIQSGSPTSSQARSSHPLMPSDDSRGYYSVSDMSPGPRSEPRLPRSGSAGNLAIDAIQAAGMTRSNSAGAIMVSPEDMSAADLALEEVPTISNLVDIPPEGSRTVRCDDPANGYEAAVALCKDIRYHRIHLTATSTIYVPMVVDSLGYCDGDRCTKKDKWVCCRKRRRCLQIKNDVPQACPPGQIPNPHEYAFCQTYPCTARDATESGCCIPANGALYEKLHGHAQLAKTTPSDTGDNTNPQFSISARRVAWLDLNQPRQSVEGNEWAALYNFMGTWGEGYGWRTPAWIKLNTGQYRELQLEIHNLNCEHTLDDIPAFQNEVDTYLVSCPRFCFGRAEEADGNSYYRWKFRKNKFTKKGIPLYSSREDRAPSTYRRASRNEIFLSRAIVESQGDRVWTKLPGTEFWMPTLVDEQGDIQPIADQIVDEVKGCGGSGFMEDEWFSSDSPICVAARTLEIFGGDNELLELTIGPRKTQYRGCTRGGIKTATLTDTARVSRSFRIGHYGNEMLRKGGGYINRKFNSLVLAHTERIKQEGPVKVMVKLTFKGLLYLNIMFFSGELIRITAPFEGTPVGYLCMLGFALGRPAYALSMSITIDASIEYLFPRARDLIKNQLDLGPTASSRRQRLITLSNSFCTQFKIQANIKGYLIFLTIETFLATLTLLEIYGQYFHIVVVRLSQLEIYNRLKKLRRSERREPEEFEVAGKDGDSRSSGEVEYFNEMQISPPKETSAEKVFVDYSIAFMIKISERIRDLFEKIVPPEGEEPTLSRLDVFGWMAGFDVSKITGDDIEAELARECRPPRCILKDFYLNEKGILSINAEALPALAENLGIDWELRQMRVNKKWFDMNDCPEGSNGDIRCQCGDTSCNINQMCSKGKCIDSPSKISPCSDSGNDSQCSCVNEICEPGDFCGLDGFCTSLEKPSSTITVTYFALQHEDIATSAEILSTICPKGEESCSNNIEVTIQE